MAKAKKKKDPDQIRAVLKKRLQEIRESLGISQLKVAAMAGMHQATYNDIENGRVDVSLSSLVRVADALGVSLSELFSSGK